MSRYFDLSQNAVLFSDCMLPMEAFMTTRDTVEMNLVSQIFDFAKSLAELRLSDIALALYSAYILLQDGKLLCYLLSTKNSLEIWFFLFADRPGLRNAEKVRSLNQAVLTALQRELSENPPHVPIKGDVSVFNRVVNKRLALRWVVLLRMTDWTFFLLHWDSNPWNSWPGFHFWDYNPWVSWKRRDLKSRNLKVQN